MHHTILGRDTGTNKQIAITQETRRQSMLLLGVSGAGKTSLIANIATMDSYQGYGLALFDWHGDVITNFIARMPEERVGDVILLELNADFPFALNPFSCANPADLEEAALTASFVMDVFKKVWGVGTETPQLAQVLRNVTFTLIQNPGTTMLEIPLLLLNDQVRAALTQNVTNSQVQLFWQTYGSLRTGERIAQASSTLNKVDAFLTQPLIRNIVGQSKTTSLNFRAIMDSGKIILVKLDPRLADLSSLIGSVMIGQLVQAAFSRREIEEAQRRQFNLFADEYQRFATENFATLLSEARKFGISTLISHQARAQLDSANRAAALNAATKIVFRVTGEDGKELAREFDHTPSPPEVIGEEPVRAPVRDVLTFLLNRGHNDPKVVAFVQKYLRLALDWKEFSKKQHTWLVSDVPLYQIDAFTVRDGVNNLNDLLYEVMATRSALRAIPSHSLFVFSVIFAFLDVLPSYSYYDSLEKLEVSEQFRRLCTPDIYRDKEKMRALCNLKSWFNKTRKQTHFEALWEFLSSLTDVMDILACHPILVDTGQYRPRYGPPRTYQDMENEIASKLTNLPNFEARVKTIGGECTIRTQLPSPSAALSGEALAARLTRIQEQTRRLYCQPRAQVEEEIRRRHARYLAEQEGQTGDIPVRRRATEESRESSQRPPRPAGRRRRVEPGA